MNEAALHIWLKSFKDRLHKKSPGTETYLSFVQGEGWVLTTVYAPFAGNNFTCKAATMEDLITQGNKWVDEYEPPQGDVRSVYATGLQIATGAGGFGGGGGGTVTSSSLVGTGGAGRSYATATQAMMQNASLQKKYNAALQGVLNSQAQQLQQISQTHLQNMNAYTNNALQGLAGTITTAIAKESKTPKTSSAFQDSYDKALKDMTAKPKSAGILGRVKKALKK